MPKTLRNTPIRDWESGDTVQGFALLTKKELRQDRNNKSYLDLEHADASGSIVAKIWADSPAMNGQFEPHQFIAFKGSVKSYRDQLQLSIDACREAVDSDSDHGFDKAKLIPSTREDIDDLWRRLDRVLSAHVRRPVLRRSFLPAPMPDAPRQLALDLPLTPRYGREDFLVSPSNERAWSRKNS